jgi:hypothetical protein
MILACSVVGCETPKPVPPPPPVVDTFPATRAEAAMQMVDHSKSFDQYVGQMPGGSGAEHRQLLVSSLTELSTILHLANGKIESPEFETRISVINSAAKTASIRSIPRARMEAVENQALQSAYQALIEIQTRYLFDDDQLPPMLDVVGEKMNTALGVIGPMHDLDATEAFRAIDAAVQRITNDMVARFTANGPVEETPAAPVAPAPAPAPTTAPATAPAPM